MKKLMRGLVAAVVAVLMIGVLRQQCRYLRQSSDTNLVDAKGSNSH